MFQVYWQVFDVAAGRFFLLNLQDVIRQAEEHLKAVSAQPGYAIAVLQVGIAIVSVRGAAGTLLLMPQGCCCCR